jgi:hypothetical protein
MQAEDFENHQLHNSIDNLIHNLNQTLSSDSLGNEQKAIIEKIGYLKWCLKNSDCALLSARELSVINNSIQSSLQHVRYFGNNGQLHQIDDPITQALNKFGSPRNKKQRRSDSSALFRDLEIKLQELETWKNQKDSQLEELVNTKRNEFENIRNDNDIKYERWIKKGIQKFKVWRSTLDKNVIIQKEYVDNKIAESEEEIKRLEELFLKKLKLEAPTQYWEDKARKHRITAWISSSVFAIIIIISLCVFIKIVWPSMNDTISELAKHKTTGLAALLPISLFLIPTLSIAWILRHISRFIIQNFSLSEDADVRRNIALTFLAITKDKENVDAEMALVLQALFRPLDGSGHAEIPPPQLDEVIKMVTRKP